MFSLFFPLCNLDIIIQGRPVLLTRILASSLYPFQPDDVNVILCISWSD